MTEFNSEYTKYWIKAIDKSIDGTVIPGNKHALHFFRKFEIDVVSQTVVDIGCSNGRMFDSLSTVSKSIIGIELDPFAATLAREKNYDLVIESRAEEMPLSDGTIDFVFSWLVFDILDQATFLCEVSRIIKLGGLFLFTFTGNDYFDDDELGLQAEANAFRKSFPKQFTNPQKLIDFLSISGFEVKNFCVFQRRGDFGRLQYVQLDLNEPIPNFYEGILVVKKMRGISLNKVKRDKLNTQLSSRHSKTSTRIAQKLGYPDSVSLFLSLGKNYSL